MGSEEGSLMLSSVAEANSVQLGARLDLTSVGLAVRRGAIDVRQ